MSAGEWRQADRQDFEARAERAEAALAAERGHAGELAAALEPFAAVVAKLEADGLADLYADADQLDWWQSPELAKFRHAARVLAAYRASEVIVSATDDGR